MPKPPSSVKSLRLPDATWEALAIEAERRGVSVNSLIAAGVAGVLREPHRLPATLPADALPPARARAEMGQPTDREITEGPKPLSTWRGPHQKPNAGKAKR